MARAIGTSEQWVSYARQHRQSDDAHGEARHGELMAVLCEIRDAIEALAPPIQVQPVTGEGERHE